MSTTDLRADVNKFYGTSAAEYILFQERHYRKIRAYCKYNLYKILSKVCDCCIEGNQYVSAVDFIDYPKEYEDVGTYEEFCYLVEGIVALGKDGKDTIIEEGKNYKNTIVAFSYKYPKDGVKYYFFARKSIGSYADLTIGMEI